MRARATRERMMPGGHPQTCAGLVVGRIQELGADERGTPAG